MTSSKRKVGLWRAVVLFVGVAWCVWLPQQSVSAGFQRGLNAKPKSNAETGRSVFNGKGVCSSCHGVDGYLDKRPQLASDTAAFIARLNPQPSDLRNPKTLRLKSDKARAKAIREGHSGTGMFPDTRMTNQELADTLAYLAILRREGGSTRR